MPYATAKPSSKSTTVAPIPQTTVFTPPASCASSWTYEPASYNAVSNGILMQNVYAFDQACFPPGFSQIGRQQDPKKPNIYSPGACPHGYSTAQLAPGDTTFATCCLSKFKYVTLSAEEQANAAGILAGCVSTFPSGDSTVVSARTGMLDFTSTTLRNVGPITMWAQPITVAFQAKDASFFTTSSSSSASRSRPTTTPARQTASSSSSATSQAHSSLSAGAKAGIGAGLGLGLLAALLLGAFFWWRRERSRRDSDTATQFGELEATETIRYEKYSEPLVMQLPASRSEVSVELGETHPLAELPADLEVSPRPQK